MSLFKQIRLGQGVRPAMIFQADVDAGSRLEVSEAPPPKPSKPPNPTKRNGKAAGDSAVLEDEAVTVPDGDAPESAAPGDGKDASATNGLNPLASAVAMMTASPRHRHLFIADLEWALMPPIALQQFRLFAKDSRPLAYGCWAFVSDEVNERLKTGVIKLKPGEWKSGDHCWLIDLVAPFGGAEGFVKLLQDSVLQGHKVALSAAVQAVIGNRTTTKKSQMS